jgi:HK97 family phage portal protein
MGLISAIASFFNFKANTPSPLDDFWYTPLNQGGYINSQGSLGLVPVWACITLISDSVSQLPLKVYRRLENGEKQELSNHSLVRLLREPNEALTPCQFKQQMIIGLLLRGNTYWLKEPSQLRYLHPDCVKVKRGANNRLVFDYAAPDGSGQTETYTQDQVFRVAGYLLDEPIGLNPIEYHRLTLGRSRDLEESGARALKNAASPSGVIEQPAGQAKGFTAEIAEAIRTAFERAYTGAKNAGKVVFLRDGLTFKPLTINNRDAQYIESRKFSVTDIARIFRVPPHMIGDLDKATFSNIEHQSIDYVTHTLMPWLVRIEEAIKRDLILEDDVFVEFNTAALLRGDTKARYESYAIGRQWGWLSPNDIRKKENMNSIEGGDTYLEPLNMKGVGQNAPIIDSNQ